MDPYVSIDVCATCAQPATWPFCEHRNGHASWIRTIVAKPVYKKDRDWLNELRAKEDEDGGT